MEWAPRIRAARGYAGLSQPELAKRLEVSIGTIKRTELGDRKPKRSELLAIADICKVPMWFLEAGWDGWRGDVEDLGEHALGEVGRRGGKDAREAG